MVGPGWLARARAQTATRLPAFRRRLLAGAALAAASLGISLGCGGRAEGTASDDETEQPDSAPVVVPPRGGPARLGGASGSVTPSVVPAISPDAVQTFCYVPSALENTPQLEELLPFLPEEAFDGSGCLSGDYSGWLLPGSCVYDPSGAELIEGRCCYRMDGVEPECP